MSKIVQVRASLQLAAALGRVPRAWDQYQGDRAVARIIGDEGRVAWGEAHHGQNLDIPRCLIGIRRGSCYIAGG